MKTQCSILIITAFFAMIWISLPSTSVVAQYPNQYQNKRQNMVQPNYTPRPAPRVMSTPSSSAYSRQMTTPKNTQGVTVQPKSLGGQTSGKSSVNKIDQSKMFSGQGTTGHKPTVPVGAQQLTSGQAGSKTIDKIQPGQTGAKVWSPAVGQSSMQPLNAGIKPGDKSKLGQTGAKTGQPTGSQTPPVLSSGITGLKAGDKPIGQTATGDKSGYCPDKYCGPSKGSGPTFTTPALQGSGKLGTGPAPTGSTTPSSKIGTTSVAAQKPGGSVPVQPLTAQKSGLGQSANCPDKYCAPAKGGNTSKAFANVMDTGQQTNQNSLPKPSDPNNKVTTTPSNKPGIENIVECNAAGNCQKIGERPVAPTQPGATAQGPNWLGPLLSGLSGLGMGPAFPGYPSGPLGYPSGPQIVEAPTPPQDTGIGSDAQPQQTGGTPQWNQPPGPGVTWRGPYGPADQDTIDSGKELRAREAEEEAARKAKENEDNARWLQEQQKKIADLPQQLREGAGEITDAITKALEDAKKKAQEKIDQAVTDAGVKAADDVIKEVDKANKGADDQAKKQQELKKQQDKARQEKEENDKEWQKTVAKRQKAEQERQAQEAAQQQQQALQQQQQQQLQQQNQQLQQQEQKDLDSRDTKIRKALGGH